MSLSHSSPHISLAVTGASGAVYALRLLEQLLQADCYVHLVLSKPGLLVLNMETALKLPAQPQALHRALCESLQVAPEQLQVYGQEQWTAPIASGSAPIQGMAICPCTSGTLGAIANGLSRNLIERAADVMLKEGRKLILVHRETPLSLIHLQNMLQLAQAGATILPANPGFYHEPQKIDDLVDFIVARILDHLAIQHALLTPWGMQPDE